MKGKRYRRRAVKEDRVDRAMRHEERYLASVSKEEGDAYLAKKSADKIAQEEQRRKTNAEESARRAAGPTQEDAEDQKKRWTLRADYLRKKLEVSESLEKRYERRVINNDASSGVSDAFLQQVARGARAESQHLQAQIDYAMKQAEKPIRVWSDISY